MELNYRDIGDRIRAARQKRGMTQDVASELVGISASHLGNIENGKTKPGLKTIVALSDALDISIDEMLCSSMRRRNKIIQSDISMLLDECTVAEASIILATVRTLTQKLREAQRSPIG